MHAAAAVGGTCLGKPHRLKQRLRVSPHSDSNMKSSTSGMAPSVIAVSKAVWPSASRACLRLLEQALNPRPDQPYRH